MGIRHHVTLNGDIIVVREDVIGTARLPRRTSNQEPNFETLKVS